MKVTVFAIAMTLLYGCLFEVHTKDRSGKEIVFEGTVLQIGKSPGVFSGDITVYQLVKYSVERVCKGRYDKKEIVVDHLILTGKELDGINVGDKVRVTVKKAGTISARWNDDGIRAPSDNVKNFYISEEVILSKAALCKNE